MSQQAKVRGLSSLEAFRSSLIVYLSQARPALEEVSAEIVRTRLWLENDQRSYWEGQMKRRMKDLEQAAQALFSARLGSLRKETALEQMAVHRAKHAVEEAELKLKTVKRWRRDFDSRVQPLAKQMEKLHSVLSNDMVKAVASLTQTLNTLAAYAEIQAPGSVAAAAPATTATDASASAVTAGPGAPKPPGAS